jgi:imidazolonepropionase-like amidohydrolase
MQISGKNLIAALLTLSCSAIDAAPAAPAQATGVIFENVRVFSGKSVELSPPANVLVVGKHIKTISTSPIADPPATAVTRIDGRGRTLMPGLIDAHSHIAVMAVTMGEALNADIGYV